MRALCWMVGLVLLCSAGCPRPEPALHLRTAQSLFDPGRGYRFAALPEPGASTVWLDVRYPVGFANDPPGKAGLAHLVEHLLFDIEVERDGHTTSIDAELRRLTLGRNAFTMADSTTYRTWLPPRALDEVLRIEVERIAVGCAGLTPEIFARSREIVLNELRTRSSPGAAALQRLVHEIAYPEDHPYRAVGSVESVAKLELSDACAFLAGPYRRGRVIVVASGAVDRAQLAQAARAFEQLPVRAPQLDQRVPLATIRPDVTHHQLDIQGSQVMALWPLPPRRSRAFRILEVVWPFLPAYINRAHPGYSATTQLIGGAHAPVLTLSLTLRSESESFAAIDAVKESVEILQRFLDWADETTWPRLWKSQAALVLADWDSLAERSSAFADYLQFELGTDYLSERIDELSKTSPAYASLPTRAVLSSARAHFLVLEPTGAFHLFESRAHALGAEGIEEHEARVDPASADQPLPVPSVRPLRRAEYHWLDNGLSLVLWPHGGTPLVQGTLVVHSGWANDPLGEEGVARVYVGEGTVTPDHMMFDAAPHLVSRSEDLTRTLAARLRADQHLALRAGAKQRIHERLVSRQALATYVLEQRVALYGPKHAYARPTMTDDALASIDDNVLRGWAGRHVVASNATLIITGRFDSDQIKRDVVSATQRARISGGSLAAAVWSSRSRGVAERPHPKQAWLAGKLDEPTSSLQLDIGFVGGRGIDADHAKRLVLEEVLTEKLFELRARWALSYSSWADYEPRRAGGTWSIGAVVDNARAAEAGAMLAQLLDQLRRDPESYRAAFVLARQKVLEHLVASSGSSSQVLAQLVELARFGLDEASNDQIAASVAALTLRTFHPFVARELAEAGQVFGAIGNADAVDAALDAAQHASAAN